MLEVAYERSVRRIAAEIGERPRGSLYLAVGESAEVRTAVEVALGERGIAVASVMLAEDEGPWARIVAAQEQSGRDAGEVILSVAGLGEMAEGKAKQVLAHLNLGRELRVTHRLHVLLWVGGLEGLDRFRTVAPDLWGHRSGVELFLSSEDFEVAFEELEAAEQPNLKTLLRETNEALAASPQPARRIQLLVERATWLNELGQRELANNSLADAENALNNHPMSPRERDEAQARIAQRKLSFLASAARTQEALAYAASMEQFSANNPLLHYALSAELATLHRDAGRTRESLHQFTKALDLTPALSISPVGGRGPNFANRANLLAQVGAFNAAKRDTIAATEEVERLRKRSSLNEAWRPMVLSHTDGIHALLNVEQGNTLRALEYAHRRTTRLIGLNARRLVRAATEGAANIYRKLGVLNDARRLAHRSIELLENDLGSIAWWACWLGTCDIDERRTDAAIAQYESSVAFYRAAETVEHDHHTRAHWLRNAARVLYHNLALVTDTPHHLQQAEYLLARAVAVADETNSPEQRALTQQSRAELASAAKQWDRADTEYLAFLTWAEANWGPYKRAEVLLDLARVARERGDLPHAATYAERAQHEVAIDPPEYRNRYTAIAAARELARIRKAMGDLQAAHGALDAALGVAQGDKLRLQEREVLLDLAELPPLPGRPDQRIEHAQRARTIAQDAAFPVDEAEAMLVLAELHLDAGRARRARSLFEQAVWIVDRIGPAAVRERAARVRGRLDG